MKDALNRYKATPIGEQLAPFLARRREVRRATPLFPALAGEADKSRDADKGNGLNGQWPAYQG